MAKQFGQQLNPHLWFDWSQMDDVNPEDKLAKITYWVLEAERQQVSYGLQLPQMKIQTGHGSYHKHQCLKALALFNVHRTGDSRE